MPKVIFKFDKEKDLWNIWTTCNYKSNWRNFKKNINPKILEICKNREFEECKKEIEEYIKKIYNSKSVIIFIDAVQKAWDSINDKFFKRLERIMKKPICSKKFIGYLTIIGRCPYDYKEPSFMFSIFSPFLNVLKTTGHEIIHIQFHNTYWKEIEEKIGKEKTADLKEALTVLLNLEFKDLWFVDDKGYESHRELREFIKKEWENEKDFDVLMEECIEYLGTK